MSKLTQKVKVKSKLIAPPRKGSSYLFNSEELSDQVPEEGNVSIPLVIDTEFVSRVMHPVTGDMMSPEYTEFLMDLSRKGLTTQIKGIHSEAPGKIFVHKQISHLVPRHTPIETQFHPVDYLKSQGYQARLFRAEKQRDLRNLPVVEFVLYAHFALAELFMIVEGEYRVDLLKFAKEKSKQQPRIEMNRRLRLSTPVKNFSRDYVELPWALELDGRLFAIRLAYVDTCAVHGVASYKDLCDACGVTLGAKDNFTSSEKSNMFKMLIERPDDFDQYALGDLEVYAALNNNGENFKNIYRALGIEDKYCPPALTIGSTIKQLFEQKLRNHLAVESDDDWNELKKILEVVSAGNLRSNASRTSALASKVEGGRCRFNRPTDRCVETPIADLDISGCYGEGQRNQLYCVGRPEIFDYNAASKVNQYLTLRQFLKEYKGELVPGAWFCRVSTNKRLKYPQDFLASWFVDSQAGDLLGLAKYASKSKSDTEQLETDEIAFEEEDGSLKIFNYEVYNAVVTHEFVEWVENVCSKEQRAELLDNLYVTVSIVYPKSARVENFETFKQAHTKHTARNTVGRTVSDEGQCTIRREDRECHAWIGLNIGELIIEDLLANRKLYPKKTPLNTLFKLCVNTLYGDMTSKHFISANVVVGNNITARARALAWYMEKGLYGFQTVTDGCAFQLNRVCYPTTDKRSLSGNNVVNLYRQEDTTKVHLKLAPLGGWDSIDVKWIEVDCLKDGEVVKVVTPQLHFSGDERGIVKPELMEGKTETKYSPELQQSHTGSFYRSKTPYTVPDPDHNGSEIVVNPAFEWVNLAAMEHLQARFKNVSVLHDESTSLKVKRGENNQPIKTYKPRKGQFEFEVKDFYQVGVYHGSANYLLMNPKESNYKARSYQVKKEHESWDLTSDGSLIRTTRYGKDNNPAKDLLTQLSEGGKLVRQEPFTKDEILKPGDYCNRAEHFDKLGLVPGDNVAKPGLLREFSLSQFTYQSFEQYIGWKRDIDSAKNKFEQSLEMYFIDDNGDLEYDRMINTIDAMIQDGVCSPVTYLNSSRHRMRDLDVNHPKMGAYRKLKEQLDERHNLS